MKKKIEQLTDQEMEILHILSELKGATVHEVQEKMLKGKKLAYSTVITLLQRMESKKLVRHTKAKHGKAFVFHANINTGQVQKNAVMQFIQRYFQDNPIPVFMTLAETRGLKKNEIQELRQLLDQLEQEQGKRK